MIKKVTQHLKHLLRPKKHASYQEAWKENTNGWGLKEGKTKCSARFEEQYSRGSEQIISKQTAWKHVYVWWGHWRTCFDQRSRKWNFFLTQHITCILYIQNFCFLSSHSCVHCKERMVCPLETHACTWIITHVKRFLNIIISHTFKIDLVDFYLLWLMEQQMSHV